VTALLLVLLLTRPDPELQPILEPCTAERPCGGPEDYPRLKVTVVNETARADKAEKRADLLEQAAVVAQKVAQDERANGLMWQRKAEELAAPPGLLQSPALWTGVGLLGGVALTVAIVVLVR
jgi:hypothetical protein